MTRLVALLVAVAFAGLAGCKVVYDAQYNDRAGELEAFRSEVPIEGQLVFYTTSAHRLYWVDTPPPLNQARMHSINPADPAGSRVDYGFEVPGNETDYQQGFAFSDTMIVECDFSSLHAHDAQSEDTDLGTAEGGDEVCGIVGNSVYFLGGDGSDGGTGLDRWIPNGASNGPTSQLVNFAANGIGTGNVITFGAVDDEHIIYDSSGMLYVLDATHKTGVWTMNTQDVLGPVAADDTGAVFASSSDGLQLGRITYDDAFTESSVNDMIDDGGYHLSFEHGDVQDIAGNGEYTLGQHHLVYRGKHGIFALGFESGYVVDVLLDRGELDDSDSLIYHDPLVTDDGFLFTEGLTDFGEDPTLYQVDLSDRLP